MYYEFEGGFFSTKVTRPFGENHIVPDVGLVTVFPMPVDTGRLTPLAPDRAISNDGDNPGDTRAAGEAC